VFCAPGFNTSRLSEHLHDPFGAFIYGEGPRLIGAQEDQVCGPVRSRPKFRHEVHVDPVDGLTAMELYEVRH
jgi:hypothetical protein